MLTDLKPHAPDKILMLMKMFREDPREAKIDLGVGVYKDASGLTPVMRAIKSAEKQLWQDETTKTYTGLVGDPAFAEAMIDLVIGGAVGRERIAAAATPGGTGAVRQALELVKMSNQGARIFVSDPTWPNHLSILAYLGLPVVEYRYFDDETRAVDFDGMMADLAKVKAGDVVLLHGCCHNPTGANLNLTQWAEVTQLVQKTGALPMIDIAYQGFGDGLDADAAGLRHMVAEVAEVLIAASCSKNFGIYRERTGILMTISEPGKTRDLAQGSLAYLNRQNYSFPPDHGARLVTMILNDADLRADWQAELEEVRKNMMDLRQQLSDALRTRAGSDRFAFLAEHRGMFSRLGATPEQVEVLRRDHGVYMVGDSRMNIAGLNSETVPKLADAIIATGI